MESETDSSENRPVGDRIKFNPWLFFGALLAPGITSLVVLAFNDDNYGEAAINTWAIISILAGLIAGIHLTLSLPLPNLPVKILVGIVSVALCTCAAGWLGMAGCSLFIEIF